MWFKNQMVYQKSVFYLHRSYRSRDNSYQFNQTRFWEKLDSFSHLANNRCSNFLGCRFVWKAIIITQDWSFHLPYFYIGSRLESKHFVQFPFHIYYIRYIYSNSFIWSLGNMCKIFNSILAMVTCDLVAASVFPHSHYY